MFKYLSMFFLSCLIVGCFSQRVDVEFREGALEMNFVDTAEGKNLVLTNNSDNTVFVIESIESESAEIDKSVVGEITLCEVANIAMYEAMAPIWHPVIGYKMSTVLFPHQKISIKLGNLDKNYIIKIKTLSANIETFKNTVRIYKGEDFRYWKNEFGSMVEVLFTKLDDEILKTWGKGRLPEGHGFIISKEFLIDIVPGSDKLFLPEGWQTKEFVFTPK